MRKRIAILLILTSSSLTLVYLLFKLSKTPNTFSNHFVRKFLHTSLLVPTYYRNLNSDNNYISGCTDHLIYVSNYYKPLEILRLNDSFTLAKSIKLVCNGNTIPYSVRCTVFSNRILLADRESGRIINFGMPLKDTSHLASISDINNFGILIPISSSSLILRHPDSVLKRNTIIKQDLIKRQITYSKQILEKQNDGFFCTDGMLNFDFASHSLIYIYFYRNQFIKFDTNLNIKFRANTIDTNEFVKIKISQISSENTYTFSAPPITINQQSCIGNGLLFIRSGLLADNEDRLVFGKSSVIDVYKLSNGRYQFSLHLLDFDGNKIKEFAFVDNHIIALQGSYITYFPVKLSDR